MCDRQVPQLEEHVAGAHTWSREVPGQAVQTVRECQACRLPWPCPEAPVRPMDQAYATTAVQLGRCLEVMQAVRHELANGEAGEGALGGIDWCREVLEARIHEVETRAPDPLGAVLQELRAERARQDEKWGGPQHDDTHTIEHFLDIMAEHAVAAEDALGVYGHAEEGPTGYRTVRKELVQIAALAVAAVESMDRQRLLEPGDEPSAAAGDAEALS